jgi:hypothetical protein
MTWRSGHARRTCYIPLTCVRGHIVACYIQGRKLKLRRPSVVLADVRGERAVLALDSPGAARMEDVRGRRTHFDVVSEARMAKEAAWPRLRKAASSIGRPRHARHGATCGATRRRSMSRFPGRHGRRYSCTGRFASATRAHLRGGVRLRKRPAWAEQLFWTFADSWSCCGQSSSIHLLD